MPILISYASWDLTLRITRVGILVRILMKVLLEDSNESFIRVGVLVRDSYESFIRGCSNQLGRS